MVRPVPWFAFIVGTLSLAAAARSFLETRAFVERAVSTQGRVGGVTTTTSGGGDSPPTTSDTPVIDFVTLDGRAMRLWSDGHDARFERRWTVGRSIRVLYDPLHPEAARTADTNSLWLMPIVLTTFAFVVLAGALASALGGSARARSSGPINAQHRAAIEGALRDGEVILWIGRPLRDAYVARIEGSLEIVAAGAAFAFAAGMASMFTLPSRAEGSMTHVLLVLAAMPAASVVWVWGSTRRARRAAAAPLYAITTQRVLRCVVDGTNVQSLWHHEPCELHVARMNDCGALLRWEYPNADSEAPDAFRLEGVEEVDELLQLLPTAHARAELHAQLSDPPRRPTGASRESKATPQ